MTARFGGLAAPAAPREPGSERRAAAAAAAGSAAQALTLAGYPPRPATRSAEVEDLARAQVGSHLALHALQRVVDRLGRAVQALGHLLVGAALEVHGEHAGLQGRERAAE